MSKKITKKSKVSSDLYFSVHIYAILDIKEKEITKISLEEDDINEELVFLDENRYVMVETDVVLLI